MGTGMCEEFRKCNSGSVENLATSCYWEAIQDGKQTVRSGTEHGKALLPPKTGLGRTQTWESGVWPSGLSLTDCWGGITVFLGLSCVFFTKKAPALLPSLLQLVQQ